MNTLKRQNSNIRTWIDQWCLSSHSKVISELITLQIKRCTDLSEPVDGVKEQRTEELSLSLRQTLHLLHHLHISHNQWTAYNSTKLSKHVFLTLNTWDASCDYLNLVINNLTVSGLAKSLARHIPGLLRFPLGLPKCITALPDGPP